MAVRCLGTVTLGPELDCKLQLELEAREKVMRVLYKWVSSDILPFFVQVPVDLVKLENPCICRIHMAYA